MADDVTVLLRTFVELVPSSGNIVLYTIIPVITKNSTAILNTRDLDNTYGRKKQHALPVVMSGNCAVINREEAYIVPHGGLLPTDVHIITASFNIESVPATRVALPVIDDLDDCQLMVRGGSFDLAFDATPKRGLPPLHVQFTNNSQTPINRWYWDFGDNQESNEKDPEHVYFDEGEYDVVLRSGASTFGFSHITKYKLIIVGLILLITPMTGSAPLKVRFDFDERQIN